MSKRRTTVAGVAATNTQGDGDGTVTLYPASLYNPATGFDDRGSGRDLYWCGYSHLGLAQSTAVWLSAQQYLNGSQSYSADGFGAACPGADPVGTLPQSLLAR
jgi:hypothetical protein